MPLLLAVGVVVTGAQGAATRMPVVTYTIALTCPDAHSSCRAPKYNTRIYAITAPGARPKALTSGAFDDSYYVDAQGLSPDRTRIAFVRDYRRVRRGKPNELWLMNVDGSGQRKLATLEDVYAVPRWSWAPDGRHIAYDGNSPDGKTVDLYVIATSGKERPLRLTSNGDQVIAGTSTWSRDGSRIAVELEDDAASVVRMSVAAADGSGVTPLCTKCDAAEWSPTGARIAYERIGFGEIVPNGVEVASPDGTDRVTLATGASGEPTWSPDGKRIAYHDTRGAYTVSPNGASRCRIAAAREIEWLTWSPDGGRLLFAGDPRGSIWSELYTVDPDGGRLLKLSRTPLSSLFPSWSPDGRAVLYVRGDTKGDRVTTVNANGTGTTYLTRPMPLHEVGFPAW